MADMKKAGVAAAAAALFATTGAPVAAAPTASVMTTTAAAVSVTRPTPSAAPTVPTQAVMNAVKAMKYDTYLEHPEDKRQSLAALQQRIADCQSKKAPCVTGIGLAKNSVLGPKTMAEILVHTKGDYVDVFNRAYVGSSVPPNPNPKEKWRTQNTGHAQEYEAATQGQFKASSFKGEGLYVVEGLRVDSSGKVSKIDLSDTGNLLKPFGLAGDYAYQHTVPAGYQPRAAQTNVAPAAKVYEHGINNVGLINPGVVESRGQPPRPTPRP